MLQCSNIVGTVAVVYPSAAIWSLLALFSDVLAQQLVHLVPPPNVPWWLGAERRGGKEPALQALSVREERVGRAAGKGNSIGLGGGRSRVHRGCRYALQ
jgi:hypothetical protein